MTTSHSVVPKLKGVIVPLATPLDEEEMIDLVGLRRLLRHVLDGGVSGIFLLGSTGEFPAIADAEKRRLIEATVVEVSGAVPVYVCTGSASSTDAIRQVKRAAELGADAVVATTPFYYAYGPGPQATLLNHFTTILAAVELPVVLYHIPQLTRIPMTLDTIERLASSPRVIGIKDSQGDMVFFERLVRLERGLPQFSVAQGADALIAVSVFAGARAVVVSGANVAPRLTVSLFEAAAAGRAEDAMRLQHQLMEVIALYHGRGSPVGVKSCLEVLGVCGKRASQPFLGMTEDEMTRIREVLPRLVLTSGSTAAA